MKILLFFVILLLSSCASDDGVYVGKQFFFIEDDCVGCQRCVTDFKCPANAIKFDSIRNKAYIDPIDCISCGQCYDIFSKQSCPTNSFRANSNIKIEGDKSSITTYQVAEDNCVSCGKCLSLFDCPAEAISLTGFNGKAVIDAESCIGCGLCKTKEFCPTDAFDKSSLENLGAITIFNSDVGSADTTISVSFVYAIEPVEGQSISSIIFDPGDGSPSTTLIDSEGLIEHKYSSHGCFSARITTTIGSEVIFSTREITVLTQERTIISSLSSNITIGVAPTEVIYTYTVASFGNEYELFFSELGDGNYTKQNIEDSTITVNYTKAGEYTAQLAVITEKFEDTISTYVSIISADSTVDIEKIQFQNSASALSFKHIANYNSAPEMVYDDLNLITTFNGLSVIWKSDHSGCDSTGVINRMLFEEKANLTALMSDGTYSFEKKFEITILATNWFYHDVKEDDCIGCERCVKSQCPDAIVIKNGKAVINPVLCWGCEAQGCHALRACPTNAITNIGPDKISEHLKEQNTK